MPGGLEPWHFPKKTGPEYPRSSLWTLYWADRNSRWLRYWDLDPSKDFHDLLAEVEADPSRAFWG
jgi:hypothetical protein